MRKGGPQLPIAIVHPALRLPEPDRRVPAPSSLRRRPASRPAQHPQTRHAVSWAMRLSIGARIVLDFAPMVDDGHLHRAGWNLNREFGVQHASNAWGTALPSGLRVPCGSHKANGHDTAAMHFPRPTLNPALDQAACLLTGTPARPEPDHDPAHGHHTQHAGGSPFHLAPAGFEPPS